MEYTQEQREEARRELARRELARRGQQQGMQSDNSDISQEEGVGSWLPRDILIGLSNLGHKTVNTPYDMAKGIEQSGQQFGQSINKSFPMEKYVGENRLPNNKSHLQQLVESFNQKNNVPEELQNKNWGINAENIPHQQEYDYAKALGEKNGGTFIDKLIQKGVEYAPDIAGGGALLRGGFRRLKGTHQLSKTEKAALESGLDFSYPKEITKQAKKYMPPSEATRNLLNESNAGKYTPSFSMQSQVGLHKRNLEKSLLPADRLLAPKVGDLKQNMLNHLENVFRSSGMEKEANELQEGIRKYKRYMKAKPYINAGLGVGLSALSIPGYNLIKKLMTNQ